MSIRTLIALSTIPFAANAVIPCTKKSSIDATKNRRTWIYEFDSEMVSLVKHNICDEWTFSSNSEEKSSVSTYRFSLNKRQRRAAQRKGFLQGCKGSYKCPNGDRCFSKMLGKVLSNGCALPERSGVPRNAANRPGINYSFEFPSSNVQLSERDIDLLVKTRPAEVQQCAINVRDRCKNQGKCFRKFFNMMRDLPIICGCLPGFKGRYCHIMDA